MEAFKSFWIDFDNPEKTIETSICSPSKASYCAIIFASSLSLPLLAELSLSLCPLASSHNGSSRDEATCLLKANSYMLKSGVSLFLLTFLLCCTVWICRPSYITWSIHFFPEVWIWFGQWKVFFNPKSTTLLLALASHSGRDNYNLVPS